MADMTVERLTDILSRSDVKLRVFVESGTFKGATTRLALDHFPQVHSIELERTLYLRARRLLAKYQRRCRLHHGDSAKLIPQLAESIQESAFWYLDAHWFNLSAWAKKKVKKVAGAPGDQAFPLWKELQALAKRPYRDIVVVDDVHCFGDPQNTNPAWRDVSLQTISALFPGHRDAVILGDQAVVWK